MIGCTFTVRGLMVLNNLRTLWSLDAARHSVNRPPFAQAVHGLRAAVRFPALVRTGDGAIGAGLEQGSTPSSTFDEA